MEDTMTDAQKDKAAREVMTLREDADRLENQGDKRGALHLRRVAQALEAAIWA